METLTLRISSSAVHVIYMRKHDSTTGGTLPSDRTLFVSNLPIDCSERILSQFFKTNGCGNLERVHFREDGSEPAPGPDNDAQDDAMSEDETSSGPRASNSSTPIPPLPTLPHRLRRTGHTAHLVFLEPTSVALALALAQSSKTPRWPPKMSSEDTPTGLALFMAQHDAMRPPLAFMRDHADLWMERFEAELARKRAVTKYKKGEAIVDDDGFTLVTRGGAYGATLGGGVGVVSRQFQLDSGSGKVAEAEQKKRKKKEKKGFYPFQLREQKRKEFMELRQKFEEDKAKIAKLKESRKFRPY